MSHCCPGVKAQMSEESHWGFPQPGSERVSQSAFILRSHRGCHLHFLCLALVYVLLHPRGTSFLCCFMNYARVSSFDLQSTASFLLGLPMTLCHYHNPIVPAANIIACHNTQVRWQTANVCVCLQCA